METETPTVNLAALETDAEKREWMLNYARVLEWDPAEGTFMPTDIEVKLDPNVGLSEGLEKFLKDNQVIPMPHLTPSGPTEDSPTE